jgi:hypothetical protein
VGADSRVDEYINRLPDWQRAICEQVRELARAADPEVEETIYRGDEVNRPALLAMFRAVIANNRAGGWRRIQASAPGRPPSR